MYGVKGVRTEVPCKMLILMWKVGTSAPANIYLYMFAYMFGAKYARRTCLQNSIHAAYSAAGKAHCQLRLRTSVHRNSASLLQSVN